MSTLSVGTIQSNTTSPPTINNSAGTAIGTFCRAWVNFNGTGTVAIRAQFNVTSITDNNVGDYTVNFTTAMADANYNVCGTVIDSAVGNSMVTGASANSFLTTSVRIGTRDGGNALRDNSTVNVAIFR